MEVLVALIALFGVASVIAWWPTVRAVATCRKPPAGILRDVELGFAEVALLPRWRPARFLNDGATLQAVDPVRRRYLLVISESREDFPADLTLDQHAARTLKKLADSIQIVGLVGPHHGNLGEFSTLQYEIEAFCEGTWLKYLHTTIAGRRAFHQVLGWATRSMYDRATFEALLQGFTEVPGPQPVLQPHPSGTRRRANESRYDIH